MSNREFTGNATPTTLSAPLSAGGSSFTIAAATGWPTGTGTLTFVVVINRGLADEEKILCESRSSTTIAVATSGRGYDGTSDQDHASGATVEHCIDTVWLDEVNDHLNATADAHDYTEITGIDERIRDVIGTALTAGNNIDLTVSDGGDTITIDVEALTTADLSDFAAAVDERARDALGTALVAGSNVTITPNDTGDTITIASTTDLPVNMGYGILGYVTTTGDFSTSTTGSDVDVTDMSVTVNVEASRLVKLTLAFGWGNNCQVKIKEGSTVLGSAHGQSFGITPSSPTEYRSSGPLVTFVASPSAGDHTYKVAIRNFTGTGSCGFNNDADFPAWLVVEDIGPA